MTEWSSPRNSMEHKIVRTKTVQNGWGRSCVTCNHVFKNGEDRHEWRMNLTGQNKYHAGGFWNVHCHECFVKNCIVWRDTLNEELNVMPPIMRELA
jgi:hypothetical protein